MIILVVGLGGFALLGTALFYVAGFGGPPKPVLAAGFSFYKSIPAKDLKLSDNEVRKLNRTLFKNREIIKETILTITGAAGGSSKGRSESKADYELSMKIVGKSGMVFTHDPSACPRSMLVGEIVRYLDRGAGVLAGYSSEPVLRNRDVTIVDM